MDDTDREQPIATVTPIRPDIQPGEKTAPGTPRARPPALPPAGTLSDDDDTWGASPRRRMRADEPDRATGFTPDDTTTFGRHGAQVPAREKDVEAIAGAPDQIDANGTYIRDELNGDENLPASEAAPPPHRRWRAVAAVALFLLVGAMIAVLTGGGHASKPRPSSTRVAQHPATRALTTHATKLSRRHARTVRHTIRSRKHATQPRRSHPAPATNIAASTHSTAGNTASQAASANPGGETQAPTGSNEYHPSETPPSSSQSTPATSSHSTPANTQSTPSMAAVASSASQTHPAGPTGPAAILGPGHCNC